ncbi:hypothetical protein DC498_17125 [Terrimonas sp.]|jgi:hypothetical protein|uniref:hypothetical protein n=1 Tax=Terrimonas sp. TaxID=1914338 RepID=UPI0006BBAAD9|nr:hypothetical protein [Terrimonas sp.]MBS1749293.1 hypothetical protein [Bacteroidota bacterium]MBX3255605.1 hypothetical protein [Chitinophagaceae bacterium]PVD50915.1 hypothetical protein DC498_17125 [Terrimonas sp.]
MCEGYVLEWLDTLISVTLNPLKSEVGSIPPEDINKLQNLIIQEKDKVQSAIKFTVFNLNDETAIKCAIKNYHSSLVSLLDQALENKGPFAENAAPQAILDNIISCIEELLFLIERRFTSYLGIDERVPATYFDLLKKELLKRLPRTIKKHREQHSLIPVLELIIREVEAFLNLPSDKHKHTFREMFYLKDLCVELEFLEYNDDATLYTTLDEVLIRMNFNSKTYIYNLTERIAAHINSVEQPSERMECLLFDLKSFKQLHKKPGMIFLTQNAVLHKQVDNWFSQEIFYLEKKIHYAIVPLKGGEQKSAPKDKEKEKLLSILSVDQMALILRAADDLRIVMARSLNSVFKNIVPFLSTPYQENISYDSMRSKSYSAEGRDKEIVTETLQQMIKKINEY